MKAHSGIGAPRRRLQAALLVSVIVLCGALPALGQDAAQNQNLRSIAGRSRQGDR